MGRGPRAALLAAVACTVGTLPHLVAALTGLAAVLHASGVAFAVLTYLGVAYLLWMAWSTWRHRREPLTGTDAQPGSSWSVTASGITLNLLNPKLTLFFFAFLPQFVPATTPHATAQMLVLSGVFMALTFVVFAAYGVCAGLLRAGPGLTAARRADPSLLRSGLRGPRAPVGVRDALSSGARRWRRQSVALSPPLSVTPAG